MTDSTHYNYSYPRDSDIQIRDGTLKNNFVKLNKATDQASSKNVVNTKNIDEGKKAKSVHLDDANTEIEKAEREREIYGFAALTSVLYGIAMITGILPSSGLVLFSLFIWYSKEKINESVRLLGQYTQLLASKRILEKLTNTFDQPGTKIYSVLDDPRLQIDKSVIDLILNFSEGKSFVISIRTILSPQSDDKSFKKSSIRVYFDTYKNQLLYRKGLKGRRYFQYDPVDSLRSATDSLKQNHRELLAGQPIKILVMATPIHVHTSTPNSPVRVINSKRYLYVEEVYVVEEAKLIDLIKALNQ